MQFDILGPLQVRDEGRPLALGRPKQRAVLAILLLDAGRVVPLDRLVEELWGRQAPPQALASVQAYVSHLRRLLEPRRPPGTPAQVLVSQAPGYRIVVPDDDLDAARFQGLAREGHALLQAGEAARAAETLTDALRLWRGPVLADFPDALFVQAERARLADLRLTALEDRLTADLAIGRHALVVAELERLTAEHPFHERLQALYMTALYRCGRQVEALQAHERFRTRLRDELGLDPGPALQDLGRDILRQAPHLDWTADAGPGTGPAPRARAVAPAPSPAAPAAATSSAVPPGVVGREAELRVVERALADAADGRGRLVLVAGEPGIGKTRLAEEAARRARAAGVTVAWGRSDPDAGAPAFWPWIQLFRELVADPTAEPLRTALAPHAADLAPLLPELADGPQQPAAPVLDPEASHFRLYRAATRALVGLATDRRLLLVLDDLQWADAASHRLLTHLAAPLPDAPIVVVATYRDRTPDGGELLDDTLAALARTGPLERLALPGLDRQDVARLVTAHFGTGPDTGLAELLRGHTGGNPFFLIEVLRLLGAHGWPGRSDGDAASLLTAQVPAGVRDVLRRRLSRLPDQTRTLLLVAAVVGEEFDQDVVRAVSGVDEDVVLDAVELAMLSGLVVEDPETVGRFRFAHGLVREAVYGEVSRARRARLHARVARALLDRPGDDTGHALQVAHHWWLAAPAVGAEQAVPHVMAAAERCLQALAHEDAERQLRRSLDLLATVPPTSGRTASELGVQLRLGTLLFQVHGSASERAWSSFTRARELAHELGDTAALLTAYHSLFELAFARADHRGAGTLAEGLLHTAVDGGDPAAVAMGRLALGRTLWCQGRPVEARGHLEQALRLARTEEVPREPMPPTITLQLQLGGVLDLLGELDAAADLVTAALEESRDEHPFVRAAALTGAALMAGLRRDLGEARARAAEALQLADRWKFPAPGGYAAVVLSWVQALDGDPGAAVPELRAHLDRIEAGGAQHLLAWGHGLLAEAQLRDSRPSEALRLLDGALTRVQRTGERLYESELHRLRALALLASHPPRREQAARAVDRAVAVAREQGSVLLQQRAVETGRVAGLLPAAAPATPPAPSVARSASQ